MKVKCSRGPLYEAVQLASSVVPQRSTIPAIMNVRLEAKKGSKEPVLELACTDLEYGMRFAVPATEVREEGTVVLPAGRILGILREATDAEIAVDSDGHLAHIRTSDASFKVVGIDPADFPNVPAFDEQAAVQIDTTDLSEMIRKTQFAVSSEVVRYALTGQLLEVKGKDLRMVASDGKRLAFIRSRSSGKHEGQKDIRVIVPTKTMNLLDRLLAGDEEIVSLNVEETQIKIKSKRAMIFSRLIDGNFPDYEAVIPSERDLKVTLAREPFFAAVRKVALMTTDKTRAIRLDFSKNRLVLFTRTQDVGEARVELPIDYKGEEFEVVFNPDYIIDYLKVVTEEKVELQLKDKTSASIFKAGKDYVYVLMPLTVTL
ncbi:MAG: DNA polymerase III subunit beta [Planctomycetes bacterium]|nr:DNA polymerase III subunit beta [Planctomycetota bacterium]